MARPKSICKMSRVRRGLESEAAGHEAVFVAVGGSNSESNPRHWLNSHAPIHVGNEGESRLRR